MHLVPIEDLAQPGLRDYVGLTDVALRKISEPVDGLYIAESSKVIGRAIAAGHRPRSVLLQGKWLPELEAMLSGFDGPIYLGSPQLLERLTGFSMHRGALASMHRPALRSVAETITDAKRIVILEDIVDHTNVGAIFRAAAGLGADAVLISPRCADPLYRRSVRVSMGTVFQIPWTRLPEWPEAGERLKDLGFTIVALALDEQAMALEHYAASVPERVALLLGAEGDGLSSAALHEADATVMIPMMRGVDSLNVASASAVALYALRPQASAGDSANRTTPDLG